MSDSQLDFYCLLSKKLCPLVGDTLSMKMEYSAGSSAPTVKILRRGVDVSTDSRAIVRVDTVSRSISLTIRSLKSDDNGTYNVELSSGGTLCDSASFTLDIKEE